MLRNGKEEIYFKWMGSPPVLLSELSRQANAISRVLQDWQCRQRLTEMKFWGKWSLAGLIPAEKSVCLNICVFICVHIILLCYFSREIKFL